MTSLTLLPRALAVTVAFACVGCIASTPPTHAIDREAIAAQPPPGMARVVFFRHIESFGNSTTLSPLHVVDERGQLLGDLHQFELFVADLPPGPHEFFAWHDNYINAHYVGAMQATLDAGRVYYVDVVRARHAKWYQTAVELDLERAAVPRDEAEDLQAVELHAEPASRWSREQAEMIQSRIAEGRAKIAAGDSGMLRPGDGVPVGAP